MTFTIVLFVIGLLAFSSDPNLSTGDSFTMSGLGMPKVNVGPYVVTGIHFLPEGNYSGECGLILSSKAFRPGEPVWVACVTPSPVQINLFVTDATMFIPIIFNDGFESGDTLAWTSTVPALPFFGDGFESGDTSKWSVTVGRE